MDRGVFGVCGVPAVNHAVEGSSRALEHVTALHRVGMGPTVSETVQTRRHVTLLPVPVSFF